MSLWEQPHTVVECYSGKDGQIVPCCEIWYFAPGVVIADGIYASPCIGEQEAFLTQQNCRDNLDELFPHEEEAPPTPLKEFLGKVGSLVASIGFVGILFDSARKR